MAAESGSLDEREQSLVREAARRAAARFPWYAQVLAGEYGIPILGDADLAPHYYAAAAESAGDAVYETSGTASGVRKKVRWSGEDHGRYVSQRAALIASLVGDSVTTACADLGTGHAAASAAEVFRAAGLRGHDIDVALPIERHLELVERWRPELLFTMPMILERLIGAGDLGYSPRWIFVLGDLAPASWRAAIATRLRMPAERIVDVFGSIEAGAIAYSDNGLGRYLFHEHIIPEVIAPARPRTDGGQLLVLTSLERDSFPAVRYVSGDVIRGLRPVVVNGQRRWTFEEHLGREGPELKHGEMLSLYSIGDQIARAAPGVAWSVRRDGLEAVIEIDERTFNDEIAAQVRSAIRSAHPAVDQMIASGLIGDVRVEPRRFDDGMSKRQWLSAVLPS